MPPGAVYVGRGSKWGNRYRAADYVESHPGASVNELRALAVADFRASLDVPECDYPIEEVGELRGRDLACWCPLEDPDGNPVPCHVDVLLALANPERQDATA